MCKASRSILKCCYPLVSSRCRATDPSTLVYCPSSLCSVLFTSASTESSQPRLSTLHLTASTYQCSFSAKKAKCRAALQHPGCLIPRDEGWLKKEPPQTSSFLSPSTNGFMSKGWLCVWSCVGRFQPRSLSSSRGPPFGLEKIQEFPSKLLSKDHLGRWRRWLLHATK